MFYSSYNSKSWGVAILLHCCLPFTLDRSITDKEGYYVFVSGYLYGEHVVFGSLYAPNVYVPSFFPQLISDLATFSSPYILLGGDFNCVSNPNIDMSRSRPTLSKNLRNCVNPLLTWICVMFGGYYILFQSPITFSLE